MPSDIPVELSEISPLDRFGAQVALQRCPILRSARPKYQLVSFKQEILHLLLNAPNFGSPEGRALWTHLARREKARSA